MSESLRETDIITRQASSVPEVYFLCHWCDSVTATGGGSAVECAGPKSTKPHPWTLMKLVDRPADHELVDKASLFLRRA